MGPIATTVKKSLKKLRKEYLSCKPINERNSSQYNVSDRSTEDPPSASNSTRNSDDIFSTKTPEKHFGCLSEDCTPKSSETKCVTSSTDTLDGLTSSATDSGISEQNSPPKKVKKIQFAPALVHEYKTSTLEEKPYRKRRRSSRPMSGGDGGSGLCKVKYAEVAVPRKVQIIDLSLKDVNEGSISIVTSADYVSPEDRLQFPSTYTVPIGTKPPQKPPRSAEKLKKINSDSSPSTDDSTRIYDRKITFGGRKRFIPMAGAARKGARDTTNLLISSSSLDLDDVEKMMSLPKLPRSILKSEPVYAEISPRNSKNIEQVDTPRNCHIASSDSSTPPPRSLETTPASSESSIVNYADSQDFLPNATSSIYNEVLTKEAKESLSLIHQTNWSLNKIDIVQSHQCKKDPKDSKETVDHKFVINMFESRPSRRWEKHLRETTSNDNFIKNTFIRMSFDSKTMDAKIIEKNIDDSIGTLEKEFKKLETESRQIDDEIKRITLRDKKESVRTRLSNFEKTKLQDELKTSEQTQIDENSNIRNSLHKDQFRRYRILKESRDIECSRMAQASKALEEIKFKKSKADWMEILVAEKVLLETSERVNLFTQQIREASYAIIPEEPLHKGTLHLSNVKFPFIKSFQQKYKANKHYTDFFLMTVSHGTKLYVSEFITGEEDPLNFQHQYTFPNVAPDFEIVMKLFCLRLRTSEEFFWQKLSCSGCCPTSKIIYEDQLTHEYQEKTVFKTSFRLCAEATLTNSQINEPSTRLMTDPQVFDRLKGIVEHRFICEDVDMAVSVSGFLDVGTLFGETYFWERKWCALKGPNLLIYNYPQEEDFGRPVEQINLEYCFGPIVTKVDNCPRRRCFQLNTGRPNDIDKHRTGTARTTLRSNPNFTLRKFYFAARDGDDYIRWVTEVGKLLHSLSYFKKLVFDEEYYECLMN